jgi:hydrogenase maturation factor
VCLTLPSRVVAVNGSLVTIATGSKRREVLSLDETVAPGDAVIVNQSYVVRRLSDDAARAIERALAIADQPPTVR